MLIANVGRNTGGLELVPGADPEDGLLDVAILRAQGIWDVIVLAVGTLIGRPPAARSPGSDPLLELHRGREIVVETARPQPVELDGNEAPSTARLEVHVEPGALRIVRPAATEANASLATAPVAGLTRGAGIAWQILAGAAAATTIYLRARAARALGRRPGLLGRHRPGGAQRGAVTAFWQRRRTPAACSIEEIAPSETAKEEESGN